MAERLYVVLGATGHVGSVVAARLLDEGKRVRVVARGAERLEPLAARGAEAMPGSIDDAPFLRRALTDADAAFVLLPPHFGSGIRAWQDKTAVGIADALKAAKVRYAVVLSSLGAELTAGNGPAAGLHTLERRIDRVSGLAALILRPGYFYENHLGSIGAIRAKGANVGALRPDLKMIHIAARDIGEVAARRLLALDWKRHAIQELHGERDLTMAEVTSALGRAIGKPELRYVQLAYEDARAGLVQAGLPEELAALYMEMTKGFNEGRLKPSAERGPDTTTPTSIERWADEVFTPAFAASAPGAGATSQAAHP